MKAPLTWLREYAALPDDLDPRDLAARYVSAGLEVETIEEAGSDVTGPVVVGRVLDFTDEPQTNGKTIRWCAVDVGDHNPPGEPHRGIVCGAHNFAVGDLVVVVLPGATLPGDFAIAARKTYGHVSDGMICAEDELGLGTDHTGIIVLPETDDHGVALTVGEPAAPVLHLRETVLDVDVTPDMAYCLSIRGLAREAAQAYGVGFIDVAALPTPAESSGGHPVRLDDPRCPLFVAVTVADLDPQAVSPGWLKRRLGLSGVRSISLAVDVTNYVMLETGQPLHGYDADRLTGPIVVRAGRDGETVTTLDDQVRRVSPDMLLITDDTGPIGLAGVMGGATTEIDDTTTTVVIEGASFEPGCISRTSRGQRLTSEASRRFERGVDPAAAYAAAHRAADLLIRHGGARLVAETVAGAMPSSPTQTMSADLPTRILGFEVTAEQSVSVLRDAGVAVEIDGDRLALTPPSWRGDLRDPYDYVEEIGQKLGLAHVPSVLPTAPAGRGFTRSQRARRAVNAALAAAGFVEVQTFPFGSAAELDQLRLGVQDVRRRQVRLANPLAETAPFLRTTLLPGLFGAVARNTSRGSDDLALWESGSVFWARADAGPAPRPPVTSRPTDAELAALDAALPDQPRHLAVVLCGDWAPAGWSAPAVRADWTHAVGFVETAARAVGATVTRRAGTAAPWHPGRCAEILAGEQVIGHGGELHPQVCTAYGLPPRTCAAELDLDALIASAPVIGSITSVSGFPVAKEDVALVVDLDVSVAAVERALLVGGGDLLESVRLFDEYRGDQVAPGHRSLAFALRLRATDRTLTDAEAATTRDAAVAAAHAATGATQRT